MGNATHENKYRHGRTILLKHLARFVLAGQTVWLIQFPRPPEDWALDVSDNKFAPVAGSDFAIAIQATDAFPGFNFWPEIAPINNANQHGSFGYIQGFETGTSINDQMVNLRSKDQPPALTPLGQTTLMPDEVVTLVERADPSPSLKGPFANAIAQNPAIVLRTPTDVNNGDSVLQRLVKRLLPAADLDRPLGAGLSFNQLIAANHKWAFLLSRERGLPMIKPEYKGVWYEDFKADGTKSGTSRNYRLPVCAEDCGPQAIAEPQPRALTPPPDLDPSAWLHVPDGDFDLMMPQFDSPANQLNQARENAVQARLGGNPYPELGGYHQGMELEPLQGTCSIQKRHAGLPSLQKRDCTDLSLNKQRVIQIGKLDGKTLTALEMTKAIPHPVSADVAAKAGLAAGTAANVGAGITFLVIDLKDGDVEGAAFGIAGTAASVATAAIETFTAGLVSSVAVFADLALIPLFLTLPAVIKEVKNYPLNDNKVELMQFSMFGNKSMTGNEGCRTPTEQNATPDPKCEVLYGPGTLEKVFTEWGHLESAAFLLACTGGYPATLPVMVQCFETIPGAYFGCRNGANGRGVASQVCSHRAYPSLDLTKIPLSITQYNLDGSTQVIQKPASEINIIDTDGSGDCLVRADVAGGYEIKEHNTIYTGPPLPSRAASPPPGAGTATNGNGAVAVLESPPPAPAPAPLKGYDESNGVCFNTPKVNLCLPEGTYDINMRDWGFQFFDASSITGVTGSITFTNKDNYVPPTLRIPDPPSNFQDIIKQGWQGDEHALIHIATDTPSPDGACFAQHVNGYGSVACLVAGSANNLTDPRMVGKVQSVGLRGKAQVALYSDQYGGKSSALISADATDLGEKGVGKDNADRWGDNVRGVWVFVPGNGTVGVGGQVRRKRRWDAEKLGDLVLRRRRSLRK
ncbi:uncharacterized protein KY384_002903 [Bacidia gigantensis]|uniref:uncharacterized protein n=1 Tax=Bacidia gigantensis TaxID=2732470 RepID=UPI001D03CF7D|nr:uncharacterized protein KY384_002903 [Bacidia gigantensis]KAG8532418.1 hypothetical protein KY384_002903 [Bacidia gigantensis]